MSSLNKGGLGATRLAGLFLVWHPSVRYDYSLCIFVLVAVLHYFAESSAPA
jgi:hypothetical protein